MTDLRDKYEKADLWTYLHVSNILPLVLGGLSLGISFYTLQSKQELLNSHVSSLETIVSREAKYTKTIEGQLNDLAATMSARIMVPKLPIATRSGGVRK